MQKMDDLIYDKIQDMPDDVLRHNIRVLEYVLPMVTTSEATEAIVVAISTNYELRITTYDLEKPVPHKGFLIRNSRFEIRNSSIFNLQSSIQGGYRSA